MPKGYWIAHVDVTDPDGYQGYLEANKAAFSKYGAHFLVRRGRFECPEGSVPDRNVIIEFPSYEAALACYSSPEYAEALAIRKRASKATIVIVEGYDGPQIA